MEAHYEGQRERVRLIPEIRINMKAKKDAENTGQDINSIITLGKRATKYVSSLIKPGDKVTIEFDVLQLGWSGMLLGYVYLSNGKMLNEEIVKAGYANVITMPPNIKYQDRLLKSLKEARERKWGLWGEWK